MARKKRITTTKPGESWRDKLHLVDFSHEEEVSIKGWLEVTDPDVFKCVEEMVDGGWSVRISPPKNGDDFWCTATAKNVSKDVDEHSFSVKYPDMGMSIVLCFYVVNVLLERGELDQLVAPKSRAWLED